MIIYRKTEVPNAKHHINLIKLQDGDDSHYVYVKDTSRLVGSQTNKMKAKKHHCKHCLHGFTTQELLKKHEDKECMAVEGQEVVMSSEPIQFKHFHKQLQHPFVIYADFECLTTKTGNVSTKTMNNNK